MSDRCLRLSSVTYATKAKEILRASGIRSRLRKTSGERDGCSYLLDVENVGVERAAEILKGSEIKFTLTDRCDYH